MNKKFHIIFALLFSTLTIFAQKTEKPVMANMADSLKYGWWTKSKQLGVNLSGSAFSDNWQGGGTNNIVIGGLFASRADRTKGKGVWSNDLQLQVGSLTNFNKVAGKSSTRESRKNLDRMFFESKYSQKINAKVNWFASLNFLSQFLKGLDYGSAASTKPLVSRMFAPAFITEAVGLEYKPTKHFFLNFGGAALRQTIVASDDVKNSTKYTGKSEIFGVPRAKSIKNQGGFQVVAGYDKNLTDKVNLKWRWQVFMPYQFNEFDHNLNAIATIKVNKYVNLNATLIGIFDRSQTSPNAAKPWQLNGGANLGFALQL
jgi:Protein of unknown function (DUF3078)